MAIPGASPTPSDSLPAGPGRTARWSLAGPLLLIGVPTMVLGLTAWAGERAWHAAELDRFVPTRLLTPSLTDVAVVVLPYALLAAMLLLILRESPRLWRAVTLVFTVPAALPAMVLLPSLNVVAGSELNGPAEYATKLALFWAPAATVVAWLVVRLVERVLTRPLAADVAASRFDVTVRLRGSKARLSVEDDRLRLRKLSAATAFGAAQTTSIPLRRVEYVQDGSLLGQTDESWELANGCWLPLSDGPALRVVGSGQQWLVPVDDAARVADFVARRVHAFASSADGPAAGSRARRAAERHVRRMESLPGRRRRRLTHNGRHVVLVISSLMASSTIWTFLNGSGTQRWTSPLVTLLLVAGGFWYWRRQQLIARVAEELPTSAAGTNDSAQVPLRGWAGGQTRSFAATSSASGTPMLA